MPRYSEQVIRTLVSTDLHGLPWEWEMELDLPEDDDPGPLVFRARGHNGSFTPKWISVSRQAEPAGGGRPSTITIEVRGEISSGTAPIELELPWTYAAQLARTIVKAARSLDHAALDAIAELLDGCEWSGADELNAIAALVRHTGREVCDVADSSEEPQPGAEDLVLCRFCQRRCSARTAHPYQGGWIGDECCWDERLRSSQ
jgi:hypothetical protein